MGKGPWRDWVIIDWQEVGELPAKIWGFLDLNDIPEGTERQLLSIHGMTIVKKGVFAIVESADYIPLQENPGPNDITSDLFTEILLETEVNDAKGDVITRRFYMVDVEAFVKPIAVIANIGAIPKCRFFVMTPKVEWSQQFIQWIEMDHAADTMEMAPTDVESEGGDGSDSISGSAGTEEQESTEAEEEEEEDSESS